MPSLSESISDLVSSSEADEVVGFVCGEGFGLDAEDFFELMAEAIFDFTYYFTGRTEAFNAPCIDN